MTEIFPNQRTVAKQVIHEFEKNSKLAVCLALGMTQCGKTGGMIATCEEFMNHPSMKIETRNIFLITGYSSLEWELQTKARFPGELAKNVFHRNKLATQFVPKVKNARDLLIIIDEVQIASGQSNTIAAVFSILGFLDMKNLVEKNIKIVLFSATPNGILYDSIDGEQKGNETTGKYMTSVIMQPGPNYHGVHHFYKNNRIKEYQPLSGQQYDKQTLVDLKDTILSKYESPRFHVVRTPTGITQFEVIINFFGTTEGGENIEGVFDKDTFQYYTYDMVGLAGNVSRPDGSVVSEIDDLLSRPPEKHTFIFVKEKARCAKTFPKKYVGIWYERYTNKAMDDVIIQGLLGRAGGYDDPGDSLIYTNTRSVRDYIDLWDSQFAPTCEWRCNSTKLVETPTENNDDDDEVHSTVSKGTWLKLISTTIPKEV